MFPRGGGGGGGGGGSSDRNDPGDMPSQREASNAHDYEYEAKRQRLLHDASGSGSAVNSNIYPSYYHNHSQNHVYNQNQQENLKHSTYFSSSPSEEAAAAIQSSIAASLNSYFATSVPSSQQQTQASGSGIYSPYRSVSRSPNPKMDHNPKNSNAYGFNPTHLGSGSTSQNSGLSSKSNHMNNPVVNPNVVRNPNYLDGASPSSAALIGQSYPAGCASASLSTSLSPFRGRSPPRSFSGHHYPAHYQGHFGTSSPPSARLSMERISPNLLGSPPMMPHPAFIHGGPAMYTPYPSISRGFPVVRLRGLPFNCSENDVCDFFRGLDVVDVLLTHKHGRFSGEAYCVFGIPIQVEFALRRNKQNMGQRYVEVFRSKKHEYYLAVATEFSDGEKLRSNDAISSYLSSKSSVDKEHMEHTGILKLRGLPFSASKKDVKEFFKDFNLKNDSIHFVVHSDGRATGEAYVEFDGPSQSKEAMCRDKMMLGSRYVELFPSSQDEVTKAIGRSQKT